MKDSDENKIKDVSSSGCYVRQRFVLCAMAFLGLCSVSAIRNHVSVTVLAMTGNSTNDNSSMSGTIYWDHVQQGHFLSSYFYGYVAGNFPGGMLLKKIGFRKVFFLSMLSSGVLELFTPLVAYQSFYLTLVIRGLVGFSHGPSFPAVNLIWSHWSPPLERSILTSLSLSGSLFGFVIMFPITGYIIKYVTWEAVFYVAGGIAILWSVLFFYFATETPQTNPRISEKEKLFIRKSLEKSEVSSDLSSRSVPWKSIFTSKYVISLIICHFCEAWYQLVILALLPMFMVSALDFDIMQSSWIAIAPVLLQFVIANISGHISDVLRKNKIVSTTFVRKFNTFVGLFMAGIMTVVSGYVESSGIAVMVVFTVGFALSGMTYPGHLSNFLDIAPAFASVLFSISNTFACTSGFIGLTIASYIITDKTMRSQWQIFYWLTCGLCCLGATIFTIFGTGIQQEWSKESKNDEDDLLKIELKTPST